MSYENMASRGNQGEELRYINPCVVMARLYNCATKVAHSARNP